MQGMTPKFAFRRGSTPTLAFTLPLEVDQSKDKLYISFAQDYAIKLELTAGQTGCSIAGKTVTAQLTQAETLALEVGDVTVQLRYLLHDGTADVSNEIPGAVLRTLKEGVIE